MTRYALIFPLVFALSACNTYLAPPYEQPPIDPPQVPYACKAEFAENFDQPLQVADSLIRYAGFSPDCSKMYTVDEARQTLRVIDLNTREVTELVPGVYLA